MTTLNYEYIRDGQKQLHSVGCTLITNDIKKFSSSLPNEKIIIFGTCSYIGEAEKYSKFLIEFLHKCFPEYKIYATGCDVKYNKEFYEKFDGAYTNEMLYKFEENSYIEDCSQISLKIQDGCHNKCSYCIINQLRSVAHSLSYQSLLRQIPSDRSVELELYGTEICQYYDKEKGLNLVGLLENLLNARKNISMISLSSIDPSSDIIFELIDFIKDNDKILPHLTLAVQSASDTVIKDMNRKYSANRLMKIHKLSSEYNISIGWEIIVGFPTETDEKFEETRKLFNILKPINNTIFSYSPRKGTSAYNMAQLNNELIEQRKQILLKDESEWLEECINKSKIKNYFVNDKHIIPSLTYDRLLQKYCQKEIINSIDIISEDLLICYVRNRYFNMVEPKELYIRYNDTAKFILKFLKEFLPETKVVLIADKNIDLDDNEFLVDFGCLIRRIND